MPIYEYSCPIHGIAEYLVRSATEEPAVCNIRLGWHPSWCKESLKKVMSVSSIKVSGTYSYSLERPSDIRLRERNQALRVK